MKWNQPVTVLLIGMVIVFPALPSVVFAKPKAPRTGMHE
jgi:hypothetical protein